MGNPGYLYGNPPLSMIQYLSRSPIAKLEMSPTAKLETQQAMQKLRFFPNALGPTTTTTAMASTLPDPTSSATSTPGPNLVGASGLFFFFFFFLELWLIGLQPHHMVLPQCHLRFNQIRSGRIAASSSAVEIKYKTIAYAMTAHKGGKIPFPHCLPSAIGGC